MLANIFISLSALGVTFGLIHWMLTGARVRLALDWPNARSLHESPVPRTGGLAILCVVLLAGSLQSPKYGVLLICAAALGIVSFFDDWHGLPITWRLAAHLFFVGVFVFLSLSVMRTHVLILLVLVLVWTTNLFNFMDGSDGLAGGMTFFGFGSYTVASWLAGDFGLAWLSTSIAFSALAFLWFNFHPARIFLGDAGSIPLGFLAAAIGMLGWQQQTWPAWFPILVFSPFIVDATATLVRRLLCGERVWQAHRSHYYQRLVLMGWGHKKTALAEYALMLVAGISAVWGIKWASSYQMVLMGIWGVIYVGLAALVDRSFRKQREQADADGSQSL